MILLQEFRTRVARQTALKLVELATALLELDREFRESFPRESIRDDDPADRSVTGVLAALGPDPRSLGALPAATELCLDRLLAAATPSPIDANLRSHARQLLAGAIALDPDSAPARLVGAQLDWLDGALDAAADGFAGAARVARSAHARASALLHRALLAGDRGELGTATELALDAARLRPDHVAAHWTAAVYAAVTGADTIADRHLDAALRAASRRVVRARSAALERHCLAIADRCDRSPRHARDVARRLQEHVALPHANGACR
ncbi:MAG: hypothetical protein FJ293_09465 [Planctomycetes bacterium]|nr:hypothetical protein [Planctomycetota bacterium]